MGSVGRHRRRRPGSRAFRVEPQQRLDPCGRRSLTRAWWWAPVGEMRSPLCRNPRSEDRGAGHERMDVAVTETRISITAALELAERRLLGLTTLPYCLTRVVGRGTKMKNFIEAHFAVFYVGTLVLSQWVADIFGFSQEQRLLWTVFVSFLVLFIIPFNIRLSAVEKRVNPSDLPSKKWLKKLDKGKPITPVHEPFSGGGSVEDDEDFDLFRSFADRVNKWLAYEDPKHDWFQKPWRLQLSSTSYDGGRYRIWFKGQSVGELQLQGLKNSSFASFKISPFPRVFSLESILELVGTIGGELHCSDEQLEKARQEMMLSALSAVWQVGPLAPYAPDLEFSMKGQLRDPQPVPQPEA